MEEISLDSLSPGRRRLVKLVLAIGHGKIEGLKIRYGEPVFNPPPRIVRRAVFGKGKGPHPPLASRNLVLNAQFIWLFRQLGQRSFTIQELSITDNFPVQILVVEEGFA